MPRWRDVETPDLPLAADDPSGRGHGSNQRGKERQVGLFGGLKVTKFDLIVCRRHWDGQTPWEVHRERYFSAVATSRARSLRFLKRLRRRLGYTP